MSNVIFTISGNCRTFMTTFESICENVIYSLFDTNYNIYIFLYLKLKDPGPKGQAGWNFSYTDINYEDLNNYIENIKIKYSKLNISSKLIYENEISDFELLKQLKNRNLYCDFLSEDSKLLRSMHNHYNFEICGKYILEKEKELNICFDYIIYIRPDLYFTRKCNNINTYNTSMVTLGKGPNHVNNDHCAIIPRIFLERFYFDRMNLYRTNSKKKYNISEEIYWDTLEKYKVQEIGCYYIKR